MADCCDNNHPDHSKQVARLNRISGQVSGVKQMISDNRYCPEIMVQLRAIRSAVKAIEANIMQLHLESCVSEALANKKFNKKEKQNKIDEVIDLFKRYET